MTSAREHIEKKTMEEIRRKDPDLELSWDDFKELCQIGENLF